MEHHQISSFYPAITEGQLERVKELINIYGLSDSDDWKGGSGLLSYAITRNRIEIAKLLLTSGCEINVEDYQLITPFHAAVENGNTEIVKMLLDRKADINVRNWHGENPLHKAIYKNKIEIIELLLKNGANVNEVTMEFEDAGTSPKQRGFAPLHIAAAGGQLDIVKVLLHYAADIDVSDVHGRTVLHFIASPFLKVYDDVRLNIRYGKIAKLLLRRGANLNAKSNVRCTPLHAAAQNGYPKVVEAFLEYNANINATELNDITPLHLSVQRGSLIITKMLLNKGAKVNAKVKNGMVSLHFAAQLGHEKIMTLLINSGAYINVRSAFNVTPLHLAARYGKLECVEILLHHGADIDAKDDEDKTVLHYLASPARNLDYFSNNILFGKIAQLLLRKGAKLDTKTEKGFTALHYAAKRGYPKVVEAFLEHNAHNVNAITKYDMTPLHLSVQENVFANEKGHISIVETLLDYGSDINMTCKKNYTALDYCHQLRDDTSKTLKLHIVKLRAANFYVSEKNLESLSGSEFNDFQNECEKEIAALKCEKIDNVNISLYDILKKDIILLAKLIRNENVAHFLKNDECKLRFPIYTNMIKCRLRIGMQRKDLIERCNEIFDHRFKNLPQLPYTFTNKLFDYLSDGDLRVFADACDASYYQ